MIENIRVTYWLRYFICDQDELLLLHRFLVFIAALHSFVPFVSLWVHFDYLNSMIYL